VVVIGWPDARLLLELWQTDEALFKSAHRLQGRVVHWELGPAPSLSPAPALVMAIDDLTRILADRVGAAGAYLVDAAHVETTGYDWVIQAGGRGAMAQASIDFGRGCGPRQACAMRAHRPHRHGKRCGWLVVRHSAGAGTRHAPGRVLRPAWRSGRGPAGTAVAIAGSLGTDRGDRRPADRLCRHAAP